MPELDETDFKVAYASTAMPVRSAVERRQWEDAASIIPPREAPPHVVAIAVWARGIGLARSGRANSPQMRICGEDSAQERTVTSPDVYHSLKSREVVSGEDRRDIHRRHLGHGGVKDGGVSRVMN
jgi:hypothetical protein